VLLDGVVVESNRNTYADIYKDVPEEEEPEPVAEPKKAAEPERPKAPETPPEPPPEPAKISEKQKFKLMVRGEWQEKEYSQDEMIARLQMAESYDLRNDELRKKHREIEPFVHLFERPEFKAIIEEKIATGELPAPTPPPPVQGDEVIRYRLYTQDAEFKEIHSQLLAWSATLPPAEMEILNTSHKAYNDAYSHFKANRKASAAPVVTTPVPNKAVEKAIANKEVAKQLAKVEPPGGATPEEGDPKRAHEKEDRRLRNAVKNRERQVVYKGRLMDPEDAWIMHRLG
jgi:hypothetical protein